MWWAGAELEGLGRIALAMVLGAAVGWERERAHRPAGLRTHMTVALAACLFTVLSNHLAAYTPAHGVEVDTTRVLQAVVTGVSFLGAGTIFSNREGSHIKGLTTAASLLATAAVGVAAALGTYVLAVGCTIALLVVLAVLGRLPSSPSE